MTCKAKHCRSCGQDKPRGDFYPRAGYITAYCKPCHDDWVLHYRANNPDKVAKWRATAGRKYHAMRGHLCCKCGGPAMSGHHGTYYCEQHA